MDGGDDFDRYFFFSLFDLTFAMILRDFDFDGFGVVLGFEAPGFVH